MESRKITSSTPDENIAWHTHTHPPTYTQNAFLLIKLLSELIYMFIAITLDVAKWDKQFTFYCIKMYLLKVSLWHITMINNRLSKEEGCCNP